MYVYVYIYIWKNSLTGLYGFEGCPKMWIDPPVAYPSRGSVATRLRATLKCDIPTNGNKFKASLGWIAHCTPNKYSKIMTTTLTPQLLQALSGPLDPRSKASKPLTLPQTT